MGSGPIILLDAIIENTGQQQLQVGGVKAVKRCLGLVRLLDPFFMVFFRVSLFFRAAEGTMETYLNR